MPTVKGNEVNVNAPATIETVAAAQKMAKGHNEPVVIWHDRINENIDYSLW